MTTAPLLVELVCEELPPKALRQLGQDFSNLLTQELQNRSLTSGPDVTSFATPRRIAVLISDVLSVAPDQPFTERLVPVSVGLDAAGQPTQALLKKLAAKKLEHVPISDLKKESDGKVEQLFYSGIASGQSLQVGLQSALEEAIELLPIPKRMTYQLADGVTTVQFVRPAHGLVALHGSDVVPVQALGLDAGRATSGHRFQGAKRVILKSANAYESVMRDEGGVMVQFDRRRDEIHKQLAEKASSLGSNLGREGDYGSLLEEVTALVEMPTVYTGDFHAEFLSMPAECLILTMRQNQKYFPLFDAAGKLTNRFLIVSNLRLEDPTNIVQGNERVVRPRLADARFFFETDKKVKLVERVPQLGTRTYHNKLGTDLERVERLRKLATRIQSRLPRGERGRPYADRAALLAKADLVTLMVGEFPELQGVMGKYYAEADGEEPSVVRAIEQHYWPRFSGDQLPVGDVSMALALADKFESIAGMFGIGQQPSGDKDPYALRRHAMGIVRILVEGGVDLSLHDLVNDAFDVFPHGKIGKAHTDVQMFILERLKSYLREKGYSTNEVEAVLYMNPVRLGEVPKQLAAVRAFSKLPEAASLAAANKRVANILRQADAKESSRKSDIVAQALKEPAERALFDALTVASAKAMPLFQAGDYSGYLTTFAVLKEPVDRFFADVMVMTEDATLRENRLALLAKLRSEMNKVAELSKLAS